MRIPTVADVVYNKLSLMITSGELRPGEKLNVDELSRKFILSKTPIREALKKLEQEGLVSSIPRSGWRVSKLSKKEFIQLNEIQELFEVYLSVNIAQKYYDKIDFDKLYKINNNIDHFIKTKQYDRILDENEKFHMCLYRVYPNEQLLESLKQVWNTIKLQRMIMVTTQEFTEKISREHEEIIDALKSKNLERIEKAIHQHFRTGEKVLAESLEND